MEVCSCYRIKDRIIGWEDPYTPKIETIEVCYGTREQDVCSCGGDRTKCNFYPKTREKALKEKTPIFGEWISVEDRLPEEPGSYLTVSQAFKYMSCDVCKFSKCLESVDKYDFHGEKEPGFYTYDGEWGYYQMDNVTHWMPLPELPKENTK